MSKIDLRKYPRLNREDFDASADHLKGFQSRDPRRMTWAILLSKALTAWPFLFGLVSGIGLTVLIGLGARITATALLFVAVFVWVLA